VDRHEDRREIDGLADHLSPWSAMLTQHGPDYGRLAQQMLDEMESLPGDEWPDHP
jgi:hypothetical protein